VLIPLEGELESSHASAAAFLRRQSSSLRDDQHPAGRDRAHLFDSERFKRKFITTLDDLRGKLGLKNQESEVRSQNEELPPKV
jgi:hypothetical protein